MLKDENGELANTPERTLEILTDATFPGSKVIEAPKEFPLDPTRVMKIEKEDWRSQEMAWKPLFVIFISALALFFFLDQEAIACLDREEPE